MPIKKTKSVETGEIETVLEQSLDETSQPHSITQLVEEATEFYSHTDAPKEFSSPIAADKEAFYGDGLSAFLITGPVSSNREAYALVSNPEARDSDHKIERFMFVTQIELSCAAVTDRLIVECKIHRRLGSEPVLEMQGPTRPAIMPMVSLVLIAANNNVINNNNNNNKAKKVCVCTLRDLKNFSVEYKFDCQEAGPLSEEIYFEAEYVHLWEHMALV